MLDVRDITTSLGGRIYGRSGRAGCPVCQGQGRPKNPALSIARGHDGRLLLWCHKGCAFFDILDALKAQGIVPGTGTWTPPSAEDLARHKAEEEAQAQKRALQAQTCWAETQPITRTVAETYLRNRGIISSLPDTLRFHPDCWHASARRFPALVARIDGCKHFAVHRTYLWPDGSRKADIQPNKAMLGSVKGGAVRISDGRGPLVVCEGIETGLSLAEALAARDVSIWAALSTSGMTTLRLPAEPHRLTIAPDGDDAGRKAADALARRADTLGWTVSKMDVPTGRDFNDVLTGADHA